jgi:hypothetical protein
MDGVTAKHFLELYCQKDITHMTWGCIVLHSYKNDKMEIRFIVVLYYITQVVII